MEMERRSFDRSREPSGLKKPRLADDQPNPNGRPFPPRPSPSLPRYNNRLAASSDRDSESNDSSLGSAAAYQPPYQELVSQYKAALSELTFNSKPIITNLTIIAGENQHAAKAISATVCANILEVPIEQKLPSLYLLDSIVKNIGRDYIKYFAARLPEVFCKAYKQIDPSLHQSMRHLFGTWKGVFPPQPLQIIEKELGFVSAVNGSSSALATSRPDPQSQRPPHSIHVNPKYLERQRLQQSSRAKGIPNDRTLPVPNSSDDVERPGRSAITGAGRPWEEGPIKINNIQRPYKQSMVEPVHEKKIGSTYGDFEHGSDVQKSSSMGLGRSGRILEPGHERPWYGTGSSSETISGQKNGYSLKQGHPKLSSARASNYDLHLEPPIQSIARSHSGLSPSWKNSEEEEFVWEMHSRVSDHDAAKLHSNSKKGWTPDDTEKLDYENHLQRAQSLHEIGSRLDRENSSESLSSEQKEQVNIGYRIPSLLQLQDSNSADGLLHSGGPIAGNTDSYSASITRLPTSADSLTRMAVRPHTTSSQTAASELGFSAHASSVPSGTLAQCKLPTLEVPSSSASTQSAMHQRPTSPSFPAQHMHQQLPNSFGEDYTQPQSLSQSEYRVPEQANVNKLLSQNIRRGNLDKVQGQEGKVSSPSVLPSQPSRQYMPQSRQSLSNESESSHQIENPHLPPVSDIRTSRTSGSSASDDSSLPPAEISGLSSTSSLLAAVMKSGILSNIASGGLPIKSFQDNEKGQPKSSDQPPIPSVTHLPQKARAKGLSVALSAPLSNDSKLAEQQHPPARGLPPSSHESDGVTEIANPISNLLSSLVAKGLISASKSDASSSSPAESQDQNVPLAASTFTSVSATSKTSAVTQSTKKEVSISEPAAKGSAALQQSTTEEVENLIGLGFKSDVVRELHPPVISSLFDDIQHQCIICSLRLKLKERLARHMDWHSLKRVDPDCPTRLTRGWYADSGAWIARTGGLPLIVESAHFIDELGAPISEDEPMVPADEDQCVCVLCGEIFEDYYSQERSKWMFKGAAFATLPLGDGKLDTTKESSKVSIVHVNCRSQSSVPDLGLVNGVKIEKGA